MATEPIADHPPPAPGRRTLEGTVRVFLAEALILPTGLVTLAFLTRRLGATNYGLFTLAATLVAWVEWTVTAMFGRATNRCIAAAADWRPVAATAVRLHLIVSAAAALLLIVLSTPIAGLFGEPALAADLRLFALDIPIFSLGHAHRQILVGLGGYRQRAVISAGRWLARLVLILALVQAGLSVTGAIAGSIGASLVELAMARRYVQPRLFGRLEFPARQLLDYALPLFLFALCLRLFDKLDLFVLKARGASAAAAGVYGAAQNLSIVPGLFAMSFAPLLLATLTRLLRDGQTDHARAMARDALRLVILLLPFAALVAGAAGEIVGLVAGAKFADAAPLLQTLIFAALGTVLIAVSTAILIAADKPGWTVGITAPMVVTALAGLPWAIARWGARGAATVTLACAWLGALAALALVAAHWRIAPPLWPLARSVAVSSAAYALAVGWPAPGLWLLLKLPVLAGAVIAGYLALGEFDARERALARSLIPWKSISPS